MATIHGGPVNDSIVGTADEDWLAGEGGNDTLGGLEGNDFLYGGSGNDIVKGGVGDDFMVAGTGNTSDGPDGIDRLYGEAGDDWLLCVLGGAGLYHGGAGTDYFWLSVPDSTPIMLDFTVAGATHILPNGATVTQCEVLLFDGSGGDDNVIGGAFRDFLAGADGEDTLQGGGGNDDISGGLGNDSILGGDGNDQLTGDAGYDTLLGGAGDDVFIWASADSRKDVWDGGDGIDTISVGNGNRPLFIDLGRGIGPQGVVLFNIERIGSTFPGISPFDDTVAGGDLGDSIGGGDGDDRLRGSGGNDSISGDKGSDTLYGGNGNDLISSGLRDRSNNVLFGGNGEDTLTGALGMDTVNGGAGQDSLTGSLAADTFVFARLADSRPGTPDTIADFRSVQADKIDVSAIDADASLAGDQGFTFTGQAPFSGSAGELCYAALQAGNVLVSGDVDGDGRADFAIVLLRVRSLADTDFVL